MSNKTLGIALVVIFAIAILGLFTPAGKIIQQVTNEPVGALTGPEIPYEYIKWGDVTVRNYRVVMSTASTTCSIRPNATSTLVFAAATVRNSSTGATLQYEWGKSTSRFATTTSLGIGSLASAAKGVVIASTTDAASLLNTNSALVFGPSDFLNLKIGSSTATTQAGTCYAQFVEIP